MIPGSAESEVQGHKTLAAIVFTDVAGFAHHANTNEQRALENLQRDMDIMRDVCARTSGAVLKTMGDGMLMRFPSANQALQCALEIQRVFHEQTKQLLPGDVLWHRIGVHLGDVVVTADDVYGDGVNVAARLQKEAKPGSIYLSRTVYDVVKGKMDFPAHYVGPRHLKGIAEPVAVWEIPAIGRIELEKRQEALMAMNMPSMPEANSGLRGARAAALVAASILLLACAIAMVVLSAKMASKDKLVRTGSVHVKALHPSGTTAGATTDAGNLAATQPKTDPAPIKPPVYDDPLDDPALVQALRTAFSHYDFAGMSGAVEASVYAETASGRSLIDRYGRLNDFMGWFNTMLDGTSQDNHLNITYDATLGTPAFVYRSGIGEVTFNTAQGQWNKRVTDLTVPEILSIASELRNQPGSSDRLASADLIRDERWLQEDAVRFAAPSTPQTP